MKLLKFAFPYTKIVLVDRETKEEKIRYYPYLPCSIECGGKKSPPTMGLLDSGADGVILPLDLAKSLNLELAIEKKPMKVVGRMVDRFTAKVNIIIGRGGRTVTFSNVKVSVPTEGDTPVIIGRNPVFDFYKITFVEPEKKFVMEPYESVFTAL